MARISMIVGGERVVVDTDPRAFTGAELGAIERYTGMTVVEFGNKLQDVTLSALAWTALAWIGARRAGQLVPWDAFCENVSILELLQSVQDADETAAPDEVADPPAVEATATTT